MDANYLKWQVDDLKRQKEILESKLRTAWGRAKKLSSQVDYWRQEAEGKGKIVVYSCENCEAKKLTPFQVFPEEIWSKILMEFVDCSNDVQSCARSHEDLRQLLEPRRTEWMLEDVFPFVADHLSKSDILKCRLVCKHWDKQIDRYLQDGQYGKRQEETLAPHLTSSLVRTDFGPANGQQGKLLRFSSQMTDIPSSRSPFVGGSLRICGRDEDDNLLAFFNQFGHHLKSVELYLEFPDYWQESDTILTRRLKYICKCLARLPRLKRLRLFTIEYLSGFSHPVDADMEKRECVQFLEELQLILCPRLETFQYGTATLNRNHSRIADQMIDALETLAFPPLRSRVHYIFESPLLWNRGIFKFNCSLSVSR